MALLDDVTSIFQEVFDRPTLIISEATKAADVEGWDSFAHINLIVALEEAFGVVFTTREVGEMQCVGDLLRLLAEKGVVSGQARR
jgi:acyl carrier protein